MPKDYLIKKKIIIYRSIAKMIKINNSLKSIFIKKFLNQIFI